VLNYSGSTGSSHRDGDIVPYVVDQLDVKAAFGAVLINAVQKNLASIVLFTDLS